MNATKIAPDFAVAGQISVADVAAAAQAGYKSIICNRPDGEGWGQPRFAEIEQAAKAAGLEAAYLPVVPGQMGPAQIKQFDELMGRLTKPVLAYCRSGARSNGLWAASRAVRR
jgi:sulfide:quinone oxidoreductase